MSELDDLLGTNDSGDAPAPSGGKGGGLRQQLEAVLAERQALREQLESLTAAQRGRDLDALFEKHKIPGLAKDFFPREGELSDKAALEFSEKYGALWGHVAPQAVTEPAEQAAAAAMQQVASTAAGPTLTPMSQEDYAAKFAQATSMAELKDLMSQLGALG